MPLSAAIPSRVFFTARLKIVLLIVLAAVIAGCGNLNGVKMLAPEQFNMTPVESNLFVERGADEATLYGLRAAMTTAEDAIRKTYGSVVSRPVVNVCISDGCYKALGGSSGTLGGSFVFLNRVLLAPGGSNWHFIAHEWSHAELFSRLNFVAWWHNPVWFDEGVAVAVSDAPQHAESQWQFLLSNGIPQPTRQELLNMRSLKQWNAANHQFGGDLNTERKAKGEALVSPVYAAAGHEIRTWLVKTGSGGLLALIARLNDGADFEHAYQTAHAEPRLKVTPTPLDAR
jgi:hypothetical protein